VERIESITAMRQRTSGLRGVGTRIGFVPTMGALHEGHLALVRIAAELADTVVVSVFVNPTQFDRADDLAAYPRDLAGDEQALASLAEETPIIVFAPSAQEMYPRPPLTQVRVSGLTDHLCGAARPGHFDGVATVVTKLLSIVAPDLAVFGRKDRQQLQVVRQLVADLDLPVRIVAGPTVREDDGLALSSRNRRLASPDRAAAVALPRSLRAAVLAAREARDAGRELEPDALRRAAAEVLAPTPVTLDYLEVVDPRTMAPVADPVPADAGLVVALAAFVGGVRLIDNVELGDRDDERRLLDATAGSDGA
jgi:pantoate--beta-alanine ligase